MQHDLETNQLLLRKTVSPGGGEGLHSSVCCWSPSKRALRTDVQTRPAERAAEPRYALEPLCERIRPRSETFPLYFYPMSSECERSEWVRGDYEKNRSLSTCRNGTPVGGKVSVRTPKQASHGASLSTSGSVRTPPCQQASHGVPTGSVVNVPQVCPLFG